MTDPWDVARYISMDGWFFFLWQIWGQKKNPYKDLSWDWPFQLLTWKLITVDSQRKLMSWNWYLEVKNAAHHAIEEGASILRLRHIARGLRDNSKSIRSMYGTCPYIQLILMLNVGRYTIDRSRVLGKHHTLPKTNVEPENCDLEDDSLFKLVIFWFHILISEGVPNQNPFNCWMIMEVFSM